MEKCIVAGLDMTQLIDSLAELRHLIQVLKLTFRRLKGIPILCTPTNWMQFLSLEVTPKIIGVITTKAIIPYAHTVSDLLYDRGNTEGRRIVPVYCLQLHSRFQPRNITGNL